MKKEIEFKVGEIVKLMPSGELIKINSFTKNGCFFTSIKYSQNVGNGGFCGLKYLQKISTC